ncbi:MAG: DNA polymerase I, partial [Firmicutes bacterium]|nr:DNA polymerase I [Bacillota bacterium]
MDKLLLLDSNSIINRAFYAIPPMVTREGVFTNAVYGYMNMLARLLTTLKPTHIGAVFDVRPPTFRHQMYPAYKATRKGMPDDLASQLPILKELLMEMGVKII